MEKDGKRQENLNKKQVPLRLSSSLFVELSRWAEDDFRSLNGQIEYLLTECVRHKRNKIEREEKNEGKKDFGSGSGS